MIGRLSSVLPLLLLVIAFEARAQVSSNPESLEEMVSQARKHLERIRVELDAQKNSFDDAETKQIQARLKDVDKAVEDVARVVHDSSRSRATTPMALAAGALLADDATGIGVADDVLLPVIALALVASYVKARMTTTSDLEKASQHLLTSTQALMLSIEMALAKKKNDGKCSCKCASHNVGPMPRGRRTAAECEQLCKDEGFTLAICK
jgi:hypothetical protein